MFLSGSVSTNQIIMAFPDLCYKLHFWSIYIEKFTFSVWLFLQIL